MKKWVRTLSWLVCMALLVTFVPVDALSSAYASEATEEIVALDALEIEVSDDDTESVPEETESEFEETELPSIEDDQADENETPETVTDAPEATVTPTVEPQVEVVPSVDYTADAGKSPAFTVGYAQIIADASLYVSEEENAIVKAEMNRDGVVYAIGRTETTDRLKVIFNAGTEAGLEDGWMDADALRPIEPIEEAADYIRFCAGEENVLYYNTLPLNAIGYRYVQTETSAPTEVPVETEAPVADDMPVETDAPQFDDEIAEDETDDGLFFVDEESDGLISLEQLQLSFGLQSVADEAKPVAKDETQENANVSAVVPAAEVSVQLVVGETRELASLLKLESQDGVSYTTDHPEIIQLDAATGAVKALSVGAANVTATSTVDPSISASCTLTVVAEAQKISFDRTKFELGVSDTYDLKTLLQTEPEGSFASYTFKSANSKYVSVTSDGIVKGVKAGKDVKITATAHNGKTAQITVRAYKAPSRITLSPKTYTLGEEQTGTVSVSFPKNCYSLYTISSENPDVVSVDADGKLVAKSAGTAKITVKTLNGKSDTATVTVLKAPDSISATVSSYTMGVEMTSKEVQGVYPEGTMCSFEYATSDADVVSVNTETGELTAKAVGSATITITSKNSKKATAVCTINVQPAPESVSFSEKNLKLGVGNTYDLKTLMKVTPDNTNASYTFKSANSKYVSVTSDGIVKGVKAGKDVKITATAHNGKTAQITVRAYKAPSRVTLTAKQATLGIGMTTELNVSFPSGTYSLYSFSVNDESIATVDAQGKLTALKAGTVTITVKTLNNHSASCTVCVKDAPSFVEFANAAYEVSEGMKLTLAPVVDANAYASFSFASSNPEIATVDANGVVIGVKAGTTKITVTTQNGHTNQRECVLTVTPAPQTLDYNDMPNPLVISKGDTVTIPEPIALDASGNECEASYQFASSNAKVAKVSGNKVTAVKAGTVTITATSHNDKKASFKLQVVSSAISGLQLAYTENTLYVNENYADTGYLYAQPTGANINYGSLKYVSSNPDVVRVSADGSYIALKPGEATITVTAVNGISAQCKLTVRKLTTSLYFKETSKTVTVTDDFKIAPVIDSDSYAPLTFASSDSSIATVDENGAVLALKPGDVSITVSTLGGLKAEMKLHILACPTGIRLNVAGMNLRVGESFKLKAELKADAAEYNDTVHFSVDDPEILAIDADGNVTALKTGTTSVSASTYNHIAAKCTVTVVADNSSTQAEFAWESATMVKGDTAELAFKLNKEAYERGFTLTSEKPDVLSVNSENWTITAKAAAPEGVKLTLTVNAQEGEVSTLAQEISCTVYVVDALETAFSAQQLKLKTYNQNNPNVSKGEAKLTGIPENLIGTYELYIQDSAVATYDVQTGAVQALDMAGETQIVCKTYNRTISCTVTVEYLPVYRAVIIGEYNQSSQTGSNLPFVGNNVSAMYAALQNSSVDGQRYEKIVSLPGNPTQAQISSAIESTFADAKEEDVSLVYIVSHGYYGRSDVNNGGYFFGTPNWSSSKPDTVITSAELMSWLKPIKGNVVLLLDSCRSGGFIKDQKNALESEGNIAVLTAQTYDKNASYFVRSDGYALEFMTYAFCYGVGYQYDTGASLSPMPADASGDNCVAIGEAFRYATGETSRLVKEKATQYFKAGSKTGFLVPGVTTKKKLTAWGGQTPQSYIPSGMEDVVIYGR